MPDASGHEGSTNSVSEGGGSVNSHTRVLSVPGRVACSTVAMLSTAMGRGQTQWPRRERAEAGEERGRVGCRPSGQSDLSIVFAVVVLGRGGNLNGRGMGKGKQSWGEG